jgi:hypothetical protein
MVVARSILWTQTEAGGEQFFPRVFNELLSTYPVACYAHADSVVVENPALGWDVSGGDWLGVNPLLARDMGWAPSDKGLLAWNLMVR